MKCYKCNQGPQHGKTVFAIDPQGQQDRRWVCRTCANEAEADRIQPGVLDTTNDIEDAIRNASGHLQDHFKQKGIFTKP